MKKINRRDYLIRMGVGAGAIVGAGTLNLQSQEKRACDSPGIVRKRAKWRLTNRSEAVRTWQRRALDFPTARPDQVVKLIFSGLMGFSWRTVSRDRFHCDVGFHMAGDKHHHHHLRLSANENAYEKPCKEVYANGPKEKIERLSFAVEGAMDMCQDVSFFQPGDAASRDCLSDPKDFRSIVDFESDYLYGTQFPEGVPKRKNVYRPTLTVTNGLFYVMRTTGSTFRAQPADGTETYVSDLGSVADVLGANVYLNPGGFVKLTVNGAEKKIHAPGEIYFMNHCFYDSAMTIECKPEPYNMQDKKRRNDFFLNYKAFKRGGAKECELFMVEGYDEEYPVEVVCHPEWFIKERLTDESPCAGSGYGGGGGLPLNP